MINVHERTKRIANVATQANLANQLSNIGVPSPEKMRVVLPRYTKLSELIHFPETQTKKRYL